MVQSSLKFLISLTVTINLKWDERITLKSCYSYLICIWFRLNYYWKLFQRLVFWYMVDTFFVHCTMLFFFSTIIFKTMSSLTHKGGYFFISIGNPINSPDFWLSISTIGFIKILFAEQTCNATSNSMHHIWWSWVSSTPYAFTLLWQEKVTGFLRKRHSKEWGHKPSIIQAWDVLKEC